MLSLIHHNVLTGLVILLLLCSIICQIIIGVLYQNMIRATDNMSTTENKLLKQCKLKFINCFELNMGVSNIPIFVDKFINKIRFLGITVTSLGHISGQLMLLSVFAAGVGICKGIIEGQTLGELLPYYIISMLGLYIYFSIASLVDIRTKKKVLKTNIIDFLENHMVMRLNQAAIDVKLEQANEEVTVQEEKVKKQLKPMFSKKEEQELEELLKEFLV